MGVDNFFCMPYSRGFIRRLLLDVENGRYPLFCNGGGGGGARDVRCKWRITEVLHYNDDDYDDYLETLPYTLHESVVNEKRIKRIDFEVEKEKEEKEDNEDNEIGGKLSRRWIWKPTHRYTFYPQHRQVVMHDGSRHHYRDIEVMRQSKEEGPVLAYFDCLLKESSESRSLRTTVWGDPYLPDYCFDGHAPGDDIAIMSEFPEVNSNSTGKGTDAWSAAAQSPDLTTVEGLWTAVNRGDAVGCHVALAKNDVKPSSDVVSLAAYLYRSEPDLAKMKYKRAIFDDVLRKYTDKNKK